MARLFATLLFLLAATVTGQTAAKETPKDAIIYLTIASNDISEDGTTYCLDLDTDTGTNAVLAPCDPTTTSQWWYFEDDIIHNYNGLCLDVCRTFGPDCHKYFSLSKRQVIVYKCNGGNNQSWKSNGNQLVSVRYGLCLDMCDSDWCTPENDAIVYGCSDDAVNQKWAVAPVGPAPSPENAVEEALIIVQ